MEKLARVNLSEIIADKIHQDILEGRLKPGDRLPTHDALCSRWGVSRVTLREALKKLDTKGFIEIHQGRGTFVRDFNREALERQFEFHTLLGRKTIIGLLEARKVIETALVRLATERGSREEMAELASLLSGMERTVAEDDPLEFARFDFRFHKLIGAMARNEFLHMMLENIQHLVESQQREMFEYHQEPTPLEAAHRDHREIYAMIKAHDGQAAAQKMYRHIEHMEARVRSFYQRADAEGRDGDEAAPERVRRTGSQAGGRR